MESTRGEYALSLPIECEKNYRKRWRFIMSSGSDSILDMYLYETNTLLEQLDGILLAAEQADTFSEENVNEIFRIMHTIKGSSAMMEFTSLMTVAHRIEDLFFIIREKTMEVVPLDLRPELFNMLFEAVDFFRGEIEKVENEEPLSEIGRAHV